MGTTQKTDQSAKFDPNSMNFFQGLTNQLGPLMQGFMQNPYGNQQFRTEQQLGSQQARNLGQTATSGLVNNMTGSGMAGGASNPAATEMLQNQNRANTGTQANLGFLAPTQAAQQRQFGTMGMAANYRPLQTGQSQVQSTGGLGTWLPQLVGAGLGLAGTAATGGMSSMFGPMMSQMAHMGQAPGAQSGMGSASPFQPTSSPIGMPSWFGGSESVGSLPSGGWGGYNMPPPPAPGSSGGGMTPWG